MPVYNGMPYLAEAVTSILEQQYRSFELIAVDDGSTDETLAHLKSYSDSRLRIIQLEHSGIVDALNAGLDACRGTLIARMDADDRAHPLRLGKQVEALLQRPEIGLIATGARHWGDAEMQAGFHAFVAWNNQLTHPQEIYHKRFVESPLIHPTVMFRKELVTAFGGYRDGNFPEDYEIWLRWLSKGVRMAKLPWIGLDWRERPTRLSRADKRYAVAAFYQTKTRYLAEWLLKKGYHEGGVVVWGAGKTSRQRSQLLDAYGIGIHAYVDIDPRKIGQVIHGRPVWSPDQLPQPGTRFLLSYVGNRGARELIFEYMRKLHYEEGRHFLLVA